MAAAKMVLTAVFVILFIGIVIPFLVGQVIDYDSLTSSDVNWLVSPVVDFIDDGIDLGIVDLNPFDILPDFFSETLRDSFVFLGLLPEFFVIILMILVILALVMGVIGIFTGG